MTEDSLIVANNGLVDNNWNLMHKNILDLFVSIFPTSRGGDVSPASTDGYSEATTTDIEEKIEKLSELVFEDRKSVV